MRARAVLVTGATGFLGRALVPRLEAGGWRVTALGCSQAPEAGDERLKVDLASGADAAPLRPWRWDAVVNLAGPVARASGTWGAERDVVLDHVRIVLGLRAAIPAAWTGRLVHTSSMTVYGAPETQPVGEAHPRRPAFMYALAKVLAEDVLTTSFAGADRWILRLPGLFSRERRAGGLYHFVRAARRGEPLAITATAPTPWDVLDVEDAAEGVARALDAGARDPGALNVSYGEPVELVSMAERIAAFAPGARVENRGGATHPVLQLDVTRAAALFGGWPPARLEDRLARLWRAWEDA